MKNKVKGIKWESMLEYESIGILKSYIDLYRDFSLPAMICDKGLRVYWSNNPAKSIFPHLTAENGLDLLLSEFGILTFVEKLAKGLACRIDSAVGLSGACVNLFPIFDGEKFSGAVAVITPPGDSRHAFSQRRMSRTHEVLEACVRQSVDGIFKTMDNLALKADMLGAGWVKQGCEGIAQNSYHILRLALNLSLFAAYQSSPPALRLGRVDIFSRINEFSGIITGISEKMDIPVAFNLPDSAVFINADLEKLELAIFNVINNALYFTKEGNRVEITGADGISFVAITVKDRGIGIPPEVLPDVTRPYFSQGKNGGPVGAGLGLAVSKVIIEEHGGELSIESKENEGTTVVLTLPKQSFSQKMEFRQETEKSAEASLSNRFSSAYVGLFDALMSPYISD